MSAGAKGWHAVKIVLALLFLLVLLGRFRGSPIDRCEAAMEQLDAAMAEVGAHDPLWDRRKAALDEVRGTGRDWRTASVYSSTAQADRERAVSDRAADRMDAASEAMIEACRAAGLSDR